MSTWVRLDLSYSQEKANIGKGIMGWCGSTPAAMSGRGNMKQQLDVLYDVQLQLRASDSFNTSLIFTKNSPQGRPPVTTTPRGQGIRKET
jgi:hypothetical protein